MRTITTFLFCTLCLTLAGCGGSYTVTGPQRGAAQQIRTVSFSPQDGNSNEVTGYITEALVTHGVGISPPVASGTRKTKDADAVVSYLDVWRWDIGTYLKSINISLYDARTGALLVSGRWEDSILHAYHRGESVARELLAQMFEKIQLQQRGEKVDNSIPATALASQPSTPELPRQTVSAPQPQAKNLNTRFDYEARQQAKTLSCRPLDIIAAEGVGTPREELTFDCGDGRKVTVVCRSGYGCA